MAVRATLIKLAVPQKKEEVPKNLSWEAQNCPTAGTILLQYPPNECNKQNGYKRGTSGLPMVVPAISFKNGFSSEESRASSKLSVGSSKLANCRCNPKGGFTKWMQKAERIQHCIYGQPIPVRATLFKVGCSSDESRGSSKLINCGHTPSRTHSN